MLKNAQGLTRSRVVDLQIRHAASSMPNLEELEFGHNRLRSLHQPAADSGVSPASILPKLARLNLEANELGDWYEIVEELAFLPRCALSLSFPPLLTSNTHHRY